ncbi:MAG: DUF3341 domain-containing protein [Candidatus Binataceae bacterium]
MSDEIALVVTFGSDAECAHGIEALHEANVHNFRSFSPFPSEKIGEAMDEARGWGRSPVRLWVLAGGIIGAITGFVLTIGTSWEWNLMTGGKPIASIPPFIIIAFELMVLTGGIFGVLGFFFHGRLPVFDPAPGYRSRFNADRFGLVVHCGEGEAANLESLMRDAGAEEIAREAA